MTDRAPLAPVRTVRQVPRVSELRELVQFERPQLGRTARRLQNALSVRDLREAARHTTPRAVFDYVDGAAEEEITAARNIAAYRRVTFHPDALRSVAEPDPSVSLLGRRISMPLVFAPTGYTRMMHHHGEPAVAGVASTSACRTRCRPWGPRRSRTCGPRRPTATCGSSSSPPATRG